MDVVDWLGLRPTHNPMRWVLPIEPHVSVRSMFLFGGCALGAAVAALEKTTGRPVVWATAQYLSYGEVGTTLDLDVTIAVEGRNTTQARAVAHVGGEEIVTVNAALGQRGLDVVEQWPKMPVVEPPEACTPRDHFSDAESLGNHLDQRWARATESAGGPTGHGADRVCVWTRMPHDFEPSAATLAVLGDWVPMGIGSLTPTPINSNSLDNTIRILGLEPTDWFLLEIEPAGIRNGFGHGQLRIWSEHGSLMAIASQSALVRERPAEGNSGMPHRFRDGGEPG